VRVRDPDAANAVAADSSSSAWWWGAAAAITDLIARDGRDAIWAASDRHDASNDGSSPTSAGASLRGWSSAEPAD
jgi:hypothetical protein